MAGPSIHAIQPIGNPGVEAGEARPMDSFPWVRKPGARGAIGEFKSALVPDQRRGRAALTCMIFGVVLMCAPCLANPLLR